ncbi:MAG: hypothetical protein IJM30_11820 [Thermoguttaceae bacterium]|nr:hypothetical protein [Thermoguttaceae bacterium]
MRKTFQRRLFPVFRNSEGDRRRDAKTSPKTRKLRLESLEDRRLLSVEPCASPSVAQVAEQAEILGASTPQAIWVVKSTSDASSASPLTLRGALAKASDGDRIVFDSALDGATITVGSTLQVGKAVTIDAGALPDGLVLDGGGTTQMMTVASGVTSVNLKGLTFANGAGSGGAVLFNGTTLTVQDCAFTANVASGETTGGAIYMQAGNLNVLDSTFDSNSAYSGGAIYVKNGALNVLNSSFDSNVATGVNGAAIYVRSGQILIDGSSFNNNSNSKTATYNGDGGGAIFISSSAATNDATVIGTTFKNNSSESCGGAVDNYSVNVALRIYSSVFTNNKGGSYGGAIYSRGALVVDANSTFSNNAGTYGGAICAYSDLSVNNATFTNNKATQGGGAIDASGCTVANSLFSNNVSNNKGGAINGSGRVDNSTFTGNTAKDGGAIYFDGDVYNSNFTNNSTVNNARGGAIFTSRANIVNSLLVGNTSSSGGAIYAYMTGGAVDIRNSTFYGNNASSGSDLYDYNLYSSSGSLSFYNSIFSLSSSGLVKSGNSITLVGHNNLTSFTDWTQSSGNKTYNSSKALFTNASGGDYTLASGSQALDCGANEYVAVDYDLAGKTRIYGGTVDLGAYERVVSSNQSTLATPTLTRVSVSENSVIVKIGSVANASEYVLEYSTSSSFTTVSTQTFDSVGSKTITGLKSGTTYYFRVKAKASGYNDSSWKSLNAATKENVATLANPSVSNTTSNNAITLNLGAVSNAENWVVEYSTNSSFSNFSVAFYPSSGQKTISGLSNNTTYYFRVKTVAVGYRDSDWTTFSATTGSSAQTLSTPTLSVTATSNSANVSIGSVANATAYVLEYSTSSNFASPTSVGYSNPGVKSIAGLASDTTYYFRVKATANGYNDSNWATASATTQSDVQTLDAPSLTVSATTASSVTLSVGSVAGASTYVLEYSTSSNFASPSSASYSTSGSKTITGLNSGTTYFFRVKATASGYEDSSWASTSATTPTVSQTLSAPSLGVSSTTTNSVTLNVGSVANATGYTIQYATNSSYSGASTVSYSTAGSKTITGLTSGTLYYVRVKATAAGYNDSAWTGVGATTKTDASTLAVPTFTSSSATSSSIAVSIGTVTNAQTYVVQYSTNSSFSPYTALSYSTPGNKTVTGLNPNTTYYLRVKATATGFEDSGWRTISATTLGNSQSLSAPSLVVSSIDKTAISLAIGSVANATSYVLQYALNSSFATYSTATFSSAGTKTISSLNPGTTYYFRVKATASGYQDSSWSQANATTSPETATLATPTLVATSVGETQVVLNIGAVTGATQYSLNYGTDPNFLSYSRKTYTSAGSKTITGLTTGATYYFRVKASGSGYADSDWRTISAVPGGNVQTLDAPTVTATPDRESISVLVSAVENAAGYVLEYGTDPSFQTANSVVYSSSGRKSITGLAPDTTYYIRVKATATGYNDSSWSVVSATTAGNVLDAPALSCSVTTNQILATIGSVLNADYYVLEYGLDPTFDECVSQSFATSGTKTLSGLASGSTYYLRVKATATGFDDSPWTSATATTQNNVQSLSAPTLSLSATKTAVVAKIGSVENATAYVLEYGEDPTFDESSIKTYASAGTKTISGLSSGTTYYLRVKATASGYQDSPWTSAEATTNSDVQTLAAPTVSVSVTKTAIVAKIGAVENATAYVLEYSDDPTFDEYTIKNYTSAGTKTISGLDPGTTYYLRVKATASGYADSPWTSLEATTTPDVQTLVAPTVSVSTTKTAIVANIGAVENATAYVLEYSDDPTFDEYTIKNYTSAGAKTISGLASGTTYYLRVKATASGYADSTWTSLEATTKADSQTLAAPSVAITANKTSLVVNIGAVSNATGYILEYSESPSYAEATTKIYSSSGAKTLSGLASGTTYYLRVKATASGYQDSPWTAREATTLQDVQTLASPTLVATAATSDSLTVTIGSVANAAKYVVEYGKNANFSGASSATRSAAGSFVISNLDPDSTYYVRVKATATGYADSAWTSISVATQPELGDPLDAPAISLSGTKTAVVVKINPVDDAQKYVVEYSTDANFATFSTKTYSSSGVKTISGLTSGTWYYVRAKATATGRADSEYCVKSKIYTGGQLAMPAVSASAVKTSVILNIKEVAGAERYVVEYSENEDFSNARTKTFTAGVKTISGLTFATKYYFRVKATGSTANDSMWNVLSYSAGQLATPKTYATSVGSDFVVVKSYNSANASGYEVRYSTSPDFSNAQYATCGATSSCRVEGLTPKTKYYFSARALGDNVSRVDSNWSTSFSATTKESAPALNAPTLSCSANSTELDLVIGAVPNATRYVLEYGTSPNFSSATSVPLSSSGALSLADLIPGTTYYVRVKATAANYLDSPWTSASATTTAASLVPPNVSVTPSKTAIVVKINPVDGAEKYVLEYGTDPSFANCATKTYASSGTKTVSGLASGTTYYFRVKSTATGSADSDWNVFQARTTGLAAPSVSASVTKSAVVLNIGSVDGAESYLVEYGTDSSFASSSTKTYPSSGVKTISGLTSGTTYYFRVKATSSSQGESSWTTLTAKTTAATSSAILDDSFEDPFDLELDDSLDALANSLAKSRSNKR